MGAATEVFRYVGTKRCARLGCPNDVVYAGQGRPPRFCSGACRARDWRRQHPGAPRPQRDGQERVVGCECRQYDPLGWLREQVRAELDDVTPRPREEILTFFVAFAAGDDVITRIVDGPMPLLDAVARVRAELRRLAPVLLVD